MIRLSSIIASMCAEIFTAVCSMSFKNRWILKTWTPSLRTSRWRTWCPTLTRKSNRTRGQTLRDITTSTASCLRRRSPCQGRNMETWRSSARDAPYWPVSVCSHMSAEFLSCSAESGWLAARCFSPLSEFQLPLPEEAHPGGGAAEHGNEPDWGGHRWDVTQSLRAQPALQHGGGGHDPAAAETAGQRQCQGGESSKRHGFFWVNLGLSFCLTWSSPFRWTQGLWLMPGRF